MTEFKNHTTKKNIISREQKASFKDDLKKKNLTAYRFCSHKLFKKKHDLDKLMQVLYLITLTMCMEEIPKDTTHSTVRITTFNRHKQTTGIC